MNPNYYIYNEISLQVAFAAYWRCMARKINFELFCCKRIPAILPNKQRRLTEKISCAHGVYSADGIPSFNNWAGANVNKKSICQFT